MKDIFSRFGKYTAVLFVFILLCALGGCSGSGGDKAESERNERTSAKNDGHGMEGENGGDAQEYTGSGEFSITFGNVTVTQLPISWSVLEKDGWMITDEDEGMVYAVREDNYIAFQFQDGSSDMIEWLYIANANTRNGYFNINDITLFGSIPLAASTSEDIMNVLPASQYELLQDGFDTYYFELYNIKGFTSLGISKESDENFVISMSCTDFSSGQETSGDGGSSGSGSGSSARPQTVEHRFYADPEDEYFVISVEILDNDSWSISWNGYGAQEVYTGCTLEERENGTYVQVNGYDHTAMEDVTGVADFVFLGYARFTMTEEVFTIQYEDSDTAGEFYRKYY